MTMKNEEKGQKQANGNVPALPSRETVVEWVKRDLDASLYFLEMLRRHPDVIEDVAGKLYDRIIKEEQAPARIDAQKVNE